MREQARRTDLVTVVAGLALAVGWIWHQMGGPGAVAMLLLGLAALVGAIFSLTRPAAISGELGVIAAGVMAIALPWAFGFTDSPVAALTSWACGVVITAAGAYGVVRANRTRRSNPELAWSAHRNEVPGVSRT
ncbi:hypothetical protein [Nocardiopsis sp. LOL_012]|uniref:SPW repeat domain-containing protein n=1 Tax=Nocardiopsis sp. LOL_012 TaxID=3345409 RepID=UPI003A892B1A